MSRILPLIKNTGNRQLITEWLTQKTDHDVISLEGVESGDPLAMTFDLCLVDRLALEEYREELQTHRDRVYPEFVPVLLLVPYKYTDELTVEVWDYVDDIIWTSTGTSVESLDTFEFKGRIEALLRTRSMSRTLFEKQQRLKVLHRMLRHNTRNSLNAVNASARSLDDPDENEHVRRILDSSSRLLGHTEKAQDIKEILDRNTKMQFELEDTVNQIVDQFRREHPYADITLDVERSVEVSAIVGLTRAIEELINNAIRHDPSDNPTIEIDICRENGSGVVTVADSGPQITEQDRRVLRGNHEPTSLDHGSGLGLWLIVWTVRRSDGSIRYQARKNGGNRITITLPEVR